MSSETTTQETTTFTKEDFYNSIFECTTKEKKKDLLIELSNTANLLIELGKTEEVKVNNVLIEMYKNEDHQTFNTFNGWKKEGYQVKKGSKCFFVWSKPLKGKSKKEEETQKKESGDKKTDSEKKYKFYSMAYLFSNAQVEALTK